MSSDADNEEVNAFLNFLSSVSGTTPPPPTPPENTGADATDQNVDDALLEELQSDALRVVCPNAKYTMIDFPPEQRTYMDRTKLRQPVECATIAKAIDREFEFFKRKTFSETGEALTWPKFQKRFGRGVARGLLESLISEQNPELLYAFMQLRCRKRQGETYLYSMRNTTGVNDLLKSSQGYGLALPHDITMILTGYRQSLNCGMNVGKASALAYVTRRKLEEQKANKLKREFEVRKEEREKLVKARQEEDTRRGSGSVAAPAPTAASALTPPITALHETPILPAVVEQADASPPAAVPAAVPAVVSTPEIYETAVLQNPEVTATAAVMSSVPPPRSKREKAKPKSGGSAKPSDLFGQKSKASGEALSKSTSAETSEVTAALVLPSTSKQKKTAAATSKKRAKVEPKLSSEKKKKTKKRKVGTKTPLKSTRQLREEQKQQKAEQAKTKPKPKPKPRGKRKTKAKETSDGGKGNAERKELMLI